MKEKLVDLKPHLLATPDQKFFKVGIFECLQGGLVDQVRAKKRLILGPGPFPNFDRIRVQECAVGGRPGPFSALFVQLEPVAGRHNFSGEAR